MENHHCDQAKHVHAHAAGRLKGQAPQLWMMLCSGFPQRHTAILPWSEAMPNGIVNVSGFRDMVSA